MPAYQPPFQLTHRMTALVADIAEWLGAWKAANCGALLPELRRGNRIRSLQASLVIEQLSVEPVTVPRGCGLQFGQNYVVYAVIVNLLIPL